MDVDVELWLCIFYLQPVSKRLTLLVVYFYFVGVLDGLSCPSTVVLEVTEMLKFVLGRFQSEPWPCRRGFWYVEGYFGIDSHGKEAIVWHRPGKVCIVHSGHFDVCVWYRVWINTSSVIYDWLQLTTYVKFTILIIMSRSFNYIIRAFLNYIKITRRVGKCLLKNFEKNASSLLIIETVVCN